MNHTEFYHTDVLRYFSGKPLELSLYEVLFQQMDAAFPLATVKVQRSQISFYGRHLFAAVSLPVRRKKDWPAHCILVTFGLGYHLDDPHIAAAVEPYPNRWTHHVVVSSPNQITEFLLGWLSEAYHFSESKR